MIKDIFGVLIIVVLLVVATAAIYSAVIGAVAYTVMTVLRAFGVV